MHHRSVSGMVAGPLEQSYLHFFIRSITTNGKDRIMGTFSVLLRLTGLCIMLNLIRYFVIGFIEQAFILEQLFGTMEKSRDYFNTEFTTIDWLTSFLYNFVMWFAMLASFHIAHPNLKGTMLVRSLKVFGLMLVLFLSISAIYMNHYSHPKDFYVWNMIDAVVVIPLVGIANGLLYPWMFGRRNVA